MRKLRKLLAWIALCVAASHAGAGRLADRAEIDTILGRNEVVETFEGKRPLPPGRLVHDLGILNFENNDWLTQIGAHYYATRFYLNDDGYEGLATRTLGDAATGRAITINYIFPTIAMGVDLSGYAGSCARGTVTLYRQSSEVLATVEVEAPQFFGWYDGGGISYAMFSASNGCFLMLDNHTYGRPGPPVPTLSTWSSAIAALLLGIVGVAALRRRQAPSDRA